MTPSFHAMRVLIVDDEPDVADLHARFVTHKEGFEVVGVVHSGSEALRGIELHAPDLVLLDFGLPDIDGREVLRRIRASNRATLEVIALTAANDLESVRYARSAGVRHYLVKPFDATSLLERLDRVRQESQSYRSVLDIGNEPRGLAQDQVDDFLRGERAPSSVKPLPKGLAAETLERVRQVLIDSKHDYSTSEIANAVGTSRATSRRYLEFLCQIGEASVEPRYGNVGRPENRYFAKHNKQAP